MTETTVEELMRLKKECTVKYESEYSLFGEMHCKSVTVRWSVRAVLYSAYLFNSLRHVVGIQDRLAGGFP